MGADPRRVAADPARVVADAGVVESEAVEKTTGDPVMWIESRSVVPGEQFDVSYDRPWLRGALYTLTRGADRDTTPDYYLSLGYGKATRPSWQPGDNPLAVRSIGFIGVGPDRLVVPDDIVTGVWTLCAENGGMRSCAEVDVAG